MLYTIPLRRRCYPYHPLFVSLFPSLTRLGSEERNYNRIRQCLIRSIWGSTAMGPPGLAHVHVPCRLFLGWLCLHAAVCTAPPAHAAGRLATQVRRLSSMSWARWPPTCCAILALLSAASLASSTSTMSSCTASIGASVLPGASPHASKQVGQLTLREARANGCRHRWSCHTICAAASQQPCRNGHTER